jgi:hypothetical protein
MSIMTVQTQIKSSMYNRLFLTSMVIHMKYKDPMYVAIGIEY